MNIPRPTKPASVRNRERFLVIAFLFFVAAFAARLAQLQIFEQERWRALADDQTRGAKEEALPRGEIRDRSGHALAVTLPLTYAVGFRPKDCAAKDSVAQILTEYLPYSYETLRKKMDITPFTYLSRKVDWLKKDLIEERRLPGIEFYREARRGYPEGSAAATIVGFTDIQGKGQEGIELSLDKLLHADPVKAEIWRDARTNTVPAVMSSDMESLTGVGAHAYLTIDLSLQRVLDRALAQALDGRVYEKACAILVDPWTGEIMALSTLPTFDPNHPGDVSDTTRKCWPFTDIYDPGSVFKIVTVSAALQEEAVSRSTMIDCEGGSYSVPGKVIHDAHGYGELSVDEVLAKSSNIGCAKIASRLPVQTFYDWIRKFGFGARCDIGLSGETAGIVPRPDNWMGPTRANLAMGQGVSVNVLQMTMAFATIANGGTLMQPRLIKAIEFPGEEVFEYSPAPLRRVLTPEVASNLTQMLELVVEEGTGKAAKIEGVKLAGKTGTAQKVNLAEKCYYEKRFVSSFGGFFPSDDPKYVLMVVVDDPRDGGYYGGQIAAPVFKAVAEEILALRFPEKLPPPKKIEELASKEEEKASEIDSSETDSAEVFVFDSLLYANVPKIPMPQLSGLPLRIAAGTLRDLGLGAQLLGNGRVTSQFPPAGLMVPVGYACEVQATSALFAQ